MAGLARSRGVFKLPADAPLTPRTFNEVTVIAQHRELLAKLSVLRLEMARHFAHLVDPLLHRGTHSSSKVGYGDDTRSPCLSIPEGGGNYTDGGKRCQYPHGTKSAKLSTTGELLC